MRGDGLWPKCYAVLQCAGPIKALLSFRIRPLGACPDHLPPDAQLAMALFCENPPLVWPMCKESCVQDTIYNTYLHSGAYQGRNPAGHPAPQVLNPAGIGGQVASAEQTWWPPSAASRPDPYRATRGRHTPSQTL